MMDLFTLPPDGWYQISAKGEFPHRPSGLLQIIDDETCGAVVSRFRDEAARPNFAGVLIDFDHFSLDQDKPSEAAGWITGLEHRPDGLWAQVRWTDRGAESVRGGRYRFISPVWRQDECAAIENNKVRPQRLINAALTNDPNITGMMPLSNRAAPRPPTLVPLSNRTAHHFARAHLMANGMYLDPQTGQYREWVGGRPWGRGGGSSRSSSRSTTSSTSAETAGSSTSDIPAKDYGSPRATAERIAELERQRVAIEGLRTPKPELPSYEEVDTRALRRELMAKGKTPNEIMGAVTAAEAENKRRRDALRAIRATIKDQYPHDPDRVDKEMTRYMDRQAADHEKDVAAWERAERAISLKVARIDAAINEENIRAQEAKASGDIRQSNDTATQAQRDAEAAEREARRRVEADKEEARRQAAAQAKAEAAKVDPATEYRRELARRRLYWQAAARGDWDAAKQIYPKADHDRNRKDLEALAPPSNSKMNQRVYERALAELQYQSPIVNRRPVAEMDEDQRKAVMAKLHGGGGGGYRARRLPHASEAYQRRYDEAFQAEVAKKLARNGNKPLTNLDLAQANADAALHASGMWGSLPGAGSITRVGAGVARGIGHSLNQPLRKLLGASKGFSFSGTMGPWLQKGREVPTLSQAKEFVRKWATDRIGYLKAQEALRRFPKAKPRPGEAPAPYAD
jgi:hypothetical protein